MCGIAGAAASQDQHVPPLEVLRRMCDVIQHRGPDSEGVHYAADVMLGMRRLAIIDLDGGAQPVHNETRDVWAVVNGEIYNFPELRARLERAGHVFRTRTDVECVVHAYEEYGEQCFREFRGMFAIALWDERRKTLLLARDRFGKKPLYYTQNARGIAFASELKSLHEMPGVSLDVDRGVIAEYMMLGYVPTPRSIFSGVRKLEPGHYLAFRQGTTTIERYWSLRYSPKLAGDEDTLADELDERIDEAVRIRLASDVPFGAFLSGGVDSSLVVARMTRHLSHRVKTFSIGFNDAVYDESADARRVAEHLGTEHHALVAEPDAVRLLEDIAWYVDEPMADSSIIPTYLVSRLAAGHVKMVLTGDGGDEMFGGYTRYVRYRQLGMLRRAGMTRLAPLAATVVRALPFRLRRRIEWVCARLGMTHPDDYISGVALAVPAKIRGLVNASVPTGFPGIRSCFLDHDETLGPLDTVLHGDVQSYMLDDILVKVDRASMANSLEARSPLLDHELAGFAARLPEDMKLRGNTTKYLLKRVAERYLPAEWVHKKKQGFAIPLTRWLRDDLAELLMDTVGSQAFAERDVFDVRAARRLAEEHRKGERDHGELLWAMLMFEMWAQRYARVAWQPAPGQVPELNSAPG